MLRTRWLGLGAILLALGLSGPLQAAPAPAAESPLAQVPAEAPIVIHLKGIERDKDRLIAMIKNAVPDLGDQVASHINEKFKEALNGRELKGLAPDGPVFTVFTEMPKQGQAEPQLALILRVTDYAEFQKGILTEDERKELKSEKGYQVATIRGKDLYFVDRNGYAVIASDKEVAEQFTKKQTGLAGKLNKDVARKLLESDVSVYVDMAAVNKEYGQQIQLGKVLLEGALQQGGAQVDKNSLEMIKAIYGGMFRAIEDSQGLLLALDFRPQGLALHIQGQVGEDTKTNTFLKNAEPGTLAGLERLTAGFMGYVGLNTNPKMFKSLSWMSGMMGTPNEESDQDAKAAFGELVEAGPESMISNMSMPMKGLQVWHYKDPAKAVAAQVKLFRSMKPGETIQTAMLKEKPEVKTGAEKHRGFTLNSVGMVWDFEKLAEKAGPGGGKDMVEAMKRMMGEGMKAWFGTDGKIYIQAFAGDWDTAKSYIDDYLDAKNPVGEKKAFEEARKHLPGKTTMVMLMDAPLYAQQIGNFIGPMLKSLGKSIDLSGVKAARGTSYLGMALTFQPERGSFDFWLPGTAVNDIRKMYEPVLKGE